MIERLWHRMANMIARAVVNRIDDAQKLQLLQLTVLEGEVVDEAERFQEFGFTSRPTIGSEAVILFPGGDRAHALVIAVDNRSERPTGLADGESMLYSSGGARVHCKADGTVEVHGGGTPVALATKADIDATNAVLASHTHLHVSPCANAGNATSAGTPSAPTAAGTTKLKGE